MPIQESLQVVVQKVQDKFGDSVVAVNIFRDELTIRVKPQVWLEAHRFLKEDEDCAFNMLIDETAADYPLRPERFDVITHLLSLPKRHRIRIKSQTAEYMPSLVPVWRTANWLEREVYDLFGIIYDGHPDLRRILLTDDWEGFPLRKDYPVEGYDI